MTTIQQDIFKTRLLGTLITFTLFLVLLQKFGPERSLVIGKDVGLKAATIDDRGNGGASIATLRTEGNKHILDCEIIPSAYRWPYCVLNFRLTDKSGKGLNLSDYRRINLDAKYSTPQQFGIRIQLINFNSAYADLNQDTSLKYNAIEIFDSHKHSPQEVNLNHMQVPTWWLSQQRVIPENSGPEFTDIRSVQIATGEQVVPGKYQLIVEKIELHGKYISDTQLYLLLLAGWILIALIYFVSTMRTTKRELRSHQQRQRQLEALNGLLNKEQRKLEERLARDPLTGVLNRDGIAPVFDKTWDAENNQKLSLIFIDIDNFKKINDVYGHNQGDLILCLFAQVLSEKTRTQDLLARWGGEEFVLACPDTALKNAIALAEKLRTAIQHTQWPEGIPITASFGVAQMQPDESPTDFIARADRALYVAKAQGRNCVRHAP